MCPAGAAGPMPTLALPLVVPWIRLDRDPKAEEEAALAAAREPWCAGFCLFGGEAEQVRRLTARLREVSDGRVFVASDMERGAGQQVRGLRVLPDAAVWGAAASPAEVHAFGLATALDARSVGVDVLFAPVLDVRSEPRNPIVGNRSFGWDPDRVARLGAAYVEGALAGGCAPTAKHWPGHGATRADSHDAVPLVAADEPTLVDRDILPFEAAVRAGCPAAMTAHVAYPALDASGVIATFSRAAVDRLRALDGGAGADVAVFTDALLMAGAATEGGEAEAARRALLAGCDALLIPSDPARLAAEVLDGATGALHAAAERAAVRLDTLCHRIAELSAPPSDELQADADVAAGRVADRALKLAGGGALERLHRGAVLVVVDDDATDDRGRVLAARGAQAGVAVHLERFAQGRATAPLRGDLAADAVVCMASVRAWKGAASVSEGALARVVALVERASIDVQVVSLTPRPIGMGVHVPGTGPDVESAIADRLLG